MGSGYGNTDFLAKLLIPEIYFEGTTKETSKNFNYLEASFFSGACMVLSEVSVIKSTLLTYQNNLTTTKITLNSPLSWPKSSITSHSCELDHKTTAPLKSVTLVIRAGRFHGLCKFCSHNKNYCHSPGKAQRATLRTTVKLLLKGVLGAGQQPILCDWVAAMENFFGGPANVGLIVLRRVVGQKAWGLGSLEVRSSQQPRSGRI